MGIKLKTHDEKAPEETDETSGPETGPVLHIVLGVSECNDKSTNRRREWMMFTLGVIAGTCSVIWLSSLCKLIMR